MITMAEGIEKDSGSSVAGRFRFSRSMVSDMGVMICSGSLCVNGGLLMGKAGGRETGAVADGHLEDGP